jgi:DNA-binding MarR family transcriptional regulator
VPERISQPNLLLQTYILGQLVGGLLADGATDGQMTPNEFAVQSVIGSFGPIMPSELAAMLGTPPTTLSAHLRRFVERGHLDRTPNPRDGRSYLVTLSPAGHDAVEKGRVALRRALADVEAELSSRDRERIAAALARYEQALRAVQTARVGKELRTRTN